jgi:uncharacterized membrane protein
VHGDYAGDFDEKLTGAVVLAAERAMRQDPAYGIRQLVDIAERALSPGTNDPSTAVQCLDQIHDLLRRIGTGPLPEGVRTDGEGRVRVVLQSPSWDDFVHLGLDEIRHWGSKSLQVHRRITRLLDDLLTVVSVERRPPLLEQQRLLLARQAEDLPSTEWLQAAPRPGRAAAPRLAPASTVAPSGVSRGEFP